MTTKRILSRNAEYQRFETLKTNRNKRHRLGEFIVEGVRNLNEAVRGGWQIKSFLYPHDKRLSGWARSMLETVPTLVNYEMPGSLMEGLSGKDDTSELLAVAAMRKDDPAPLLDAANPLLALFDRPSNRGNLGTVLRSCDALGVDGLIVTGHAVDLYDPDTVVSSMGSFFRVPAVRMADNATVDAFIAAMKARHPGFLTVGTTAHAAADIGSIDLTGPVMLLLGNEADGLSNHFSETCDAMASIPMDSRSSASSLNVACAATVLFYEAARQRAATPR